MKKIWFFFCCILAAGLCIACTAENTANTRKPYHPLGDTATTAATTTTTTIAHTIPALRRNLPMQVQLEVTPVLQNPELPTGCEITSLSMLLQYHGFSIDKVTLAKEFLPCSDNIAQYTLDDVFIGSPFASNGFGCYASVLEQTANAYLQTQNSTWRAKDITGCSPKNILYTIAAGHPVVMWETINLNEVTETPAWTTHDGRTVVWCNLEHCVLLYGYDRIHHTVSVCDPMKSAVTYDMEQYFHIYEAMHKRALVLENQAP